MLRVVWLVNLICDETENIVKFKSKAQCETKFPEWIEQINGNNKQVNEDKDDENEKKKVDNGDVNMNVSSKSTLYWGLWTKQQWDEKWQNIKLPALPKIPSLPPLPPYQ